MFFDPNSAGKNHFVYFIGVVEDISDPMTLGRAKVRAFSFHPESREEVPTKDLPWATVLQPATSGSIAGIGWSPNGLKMGSWVFGLFLDGDTAQYPLVLGSLPTIHLPGAPGTQSQTNVGYTASGDKYSGAAATPPYHGQGIENPTKYNPASLPNSPTGNGAVIKDDGRYLTLQDRSNWPLKYYTADPAGGHGLACKAHGELSIHLASALALEQLTTDVGRGPFTINSAYRTPSYNASVGGAAHSQHIQGRAFDVNKRSFGDPITFLKLAVKNGFVGFGIYRDFIHIDTAHGRTWNAATNSPEVQAALKSAGWYHGKPGLEGIKVTPGANNSVSGAATSSLSPASPTNAAVPSTTNNSAITEIRSNLQSRGYNDVQIAGILGSWQQESNFDPTNINPKTGAFGLGQWVGSRKAALFSYAQSNNLDPYQILTQIAFFDYEMRSIEGRAFAMLQNATSPTDAVTAMNYYERFSGYQYGPNGIEAGQRYDFANAFISAFTDQPNAIRGFQDPTNSLPYYNYRGQPSTNQAARGLNANMQQVNGARTAAKPTGGFPIAGDTGTFGEPESSFAPQYPYNTTYGTQSGHLIEFDDTPGSERIRIAHRSGSEVVYSAKGTVVNKTLGNSYHIVHSNEFHGVSGKFLVTATDDILLRTTSDLVIHSDGSTTMLSHNDFTQSISGKLNIGVGEVLEIKANQRIIIEAPKIDFYSTGDFNMMAEGNMNIKAKTFKLLATQGDVDIKASEHLVLNGGASANLKGPTTYLDDNVVEGSGAAKTTVDPTEASSADIGKIDPRRKVMKNGPARENPDAIPGYTEGMQNYGGQMPTTNAPPTTNNGAPSLSTNPGNASSTSSTDSSADMPIYAQATKDIESSGGNYSAIGPLTSNGDRAYGAYQVMGANVPSWTQEALGYSLTPDQFLADPAAQDAVFNYKFGQYVDKYGSASDAASVWFSGRPLSMSSGLSDGFTSVPTYVSSFNNNVARIRAGGR